MNNSVLHSAKQTLESIEQQLADAKEELNHAQLKFNKCNEAFIAYGKWVEFLASGWSDKESSSSSDLLIDVDVDDVRVLDSTYEKLSNYNQKTLYAIERIARGCSKTDIAFFIKENEPRKSLSDIKASLSQPINKLIKDGSIIKVDPKIKMKGNWFALPNWHDIKTGWKNERFPLAERKYNDSSKIVFEI